MKHSEDYYRVIVAGNGDFETVHKGSNLEVAKRVAKHYKDIQYSSVYLKKFHVEYEDVDF